MTLYYPVLCDCVTNIIYQILLFVFPLYNVINVEKPTENPIQSLVYGFSYKNVFICELPDWEKITVWMHFRDDITSNVHDMC